MRTLATLLGITVSLSALLGCGDSNPIGSVEVIPPTQDTSRDILFADLYFDVTAQRGDAILLLDGSPSKGVSLEAQGLTVDTVLTPASATALAFEMKDGLLNIGVPANIDPLELHIAYSYKTQMNFDGYLKEKATFLWPAFCGNLYPCKSVPSEGAQFAINVGGLAAGDYAVLPAVIPADAPTYMPAFALGDYVYKMLGKTTAGTEVGAAYTPSEEAVAMQGAKDLPAFFDWYEKTFGEYTFGPKVASVSVNWGQGALGGMEHHPFWHIAKDNMKDPLTHAHEAAHGWFGDGVRIACWEDFVLSEGTASYLAARAVEAVSGAMAGQAVWDGYMAKLDAVLATEDTKLMLDTCNEIELIKHPLWSKVTYMKGAFFYKAVEGQVGRDKLDGAIKKFYGINKNKAARMQDMIDMIQAETGADISMHVNGWLKGLGKP